VVAAVPAVSKMFN